MWAMSIYQDKTLTFLTHIHIFIFFGWSPKHWQTFGRNISSYIRKFGREWSFFLRKISSYLYEKNKIRDFFIMFELNVSQLLVGFDRACAPVRCAHPSFWAHHHVKRGAARPPPIAASLLLIYPPPKLFLSNPIYYRKQSPVTILLHFSFFNKGDHYYYTILR
jgi:hypothetical protein